MAIPAGLDTLAELEAEVTETFAPSQSIPDRIKENLPAELYRILDYFRFRRLTRPVFDLHDLMDPDTAPRAALEVMLREFDLPIWNDATDAQLRQVIADIVTIVGLRNTIQGWETFLNDLAPSGITISITRSDWNGRIFWWSRYRHGFPNQAMIDAVNTSQNRCTHLFAPEMLDVTITITVAGGASLPAAYKEWLEATPPYFLPVYNPAVTTIIYNYTA